MAQRPLTVMIALSDSEQAEELEQALGERGHVAVATSFDLEQPEDFDVVVTDGEPVDAATPHIVLGAAAPGGNIHAVLPHSADAALIAAVTTVVAAGYRLSAADAADANETADTDEAVLPRDVPHNLSLSPRELETLALLADGASNKVIARQLKVSVHTAKFHVAAVLAKLHAQNRADAVAIALRQGLLYL
ncbi:LuxR C-terminal-related transcriptional regulator [Sinorhizobium garamanticum]|uniref:LuxR C-terminal-related transcriptional regulator n=1 Tax=Sinorhizobium garamanticum TaxID=680247 RepID=A0ABY8DIX8_9HYPH|nr:LuxR C-terminal-related transcriptional regulator [Sinorhizobium garamanticum]WEX90874.1 LuxR C-terminal-related transcriptional regulator [Sinorhizobium garamanticum]